MNSKIQSSNSNSPLEVFLWILVCVFILGGVVANFYFADTYELPIRLVGWIILIAILLGMIALTKFGKTTWVFLKEARMEMRKITWPNRQETVQTTLVVLAMVVVVALILWGIDTFLLWGIGVLTGHTG